MFPALALAQAVAPASSASASSASGSSAASEEVIALSPFEVTADSPDSYSALNTNSVTRFRTELAKLPVSADVFTETFMDDIAATSLEDMVVGYGTGTGTGGSDPANTADSTRPGDRASNVNVKIRGLDAGSMRINSFGQGGIDDTFTTERVDVVRGPQSLLNGGVGGGGVVNAVSKQARFNSKMARLQLRLDNYSSMRGVLDYGYGTKRFALRLSALKEDTRYARALLGNRAEGVYAQFAVQPTSSTTVRFEVSEKCADNVLSTNSTTLVMPAATINGVRLPADPRNGQILRLLLAQGQSDDIMGGRLNWDTIDSLKGLYYGQRRDNLHYEATLEQRLGQWGTLQLAAMRDLSAMNRADFNSYTNLSAPLRNSNPYNDWAVGYQPGNTYEGWHRKGWRANFAGEFNLFGGRAHSQVLLGGQYETVYNKRRQQTYWLADPNGNIVVNQAQITNNNVGRTPMPTQWLSLANGLVDTLPFERRAALITANGLTYALDEKTFVDVVPPTPTNPKGVRGNGSYWDQYGYTDSYYAALSTNWFGDRFTTLGGYRMSNVESKRYQAADFKRMQKSPGSLNLGVNFRLNDFLRPYYGYSNSFNPPDIVQFGPTGDLTQPSKGIGHEVGVKFLPRTGVISGSISYFRVDSKSEQVSIQTDVRDDINPAGINGAYSPSQNWINLDRKSEGGELILTAQPTPNWRSRLSFAVTDGRVAESKKFGILYNDEFNTDGKGGVTYGDGTPVLVAIDPSQNSNPNAPRTQLTVAMMNNPASGYFAVLDPDSGRITNAAALRLNTTSATGATVGTGRRGLPISAHQLKFTDPNNHQGFITVSQEGEPTVGYARYSANFTNNYSFSEGCLKGLTIGGTAFFRAKDRSYAYTRLIRDAAGIVTGSERRMFSLPDSFRLNALISYKRKLSRLVTWTTQLNVDNLFNQYDIVLLPNSSSGDPRTAKFTIEPRSFVWTNTFSF